MSGIWRNTQLDGNSETPYPTSSRANANIVSISSKYSLPPDPRQWGSDLSLNLVEPDDELHNPRGRMNAVERDGHPLTARGLTNFGCLVVLCVGLVTLFAGYPLISHFTTKVMSTQGGFNLGGINGTGQIPALPGGRGLIDIETPKDAYTRPSWKDGSMMRLVFSDEFNVPGRSFYPGDDPYWEAVDLHYWQTNNLEWYDPAAVTTTNGSLVITLSKQQTHNLNYQGGMVATWNKFCFTGGYIETSATLPGASNVLGLWPAVWTMGNLGRAGYGASLDGMWPYSYDACDVGTVANQTINGQPYAATVSGDKANGGALSYLPGQRLSRCTCPGEPHPGPAHQDGSYVGRSGPEIDVFEAQVDPNTLIGKVSQSAQWAPFNQGYNWQNTSQNMIIPDTSISTLNTYQGGITQQATSVVTATNQQCYQLDGACFSVYGFEYKPGFDNAYITWISDNKVSWTLMAAGVGPDNAVQISARPVPQEPMYIIVNLGMSQNFGKIDFEHLTFPTTLTIDYIRVYQDQNAINIGCDPKDFPTENYINAYLEAYSNPNLTTWTSDFKQPMPKNRLVQTCN
ncbi:glycoside hydrolase family 16 protein [Tricholoma matsutake]|nr:glycoside hydrolase family 16 protein [Tricholoma matsutake 945]